MLARCAISRAAIRQSCLDQPSQTGAACVACACKLVSETAWVHTGQIDACQLKLIHKSLQSRRETALRALDGTHRIISVRKAINRLRHLVLTPVAIWTSLALSQTADAQSYSGDPAGSGPIVGAIRWIQGTLLGTVATVVAVIAIASIGFMMLTGRMNWRYGATVILGAFILFGAASIVAGIQSSASVGY